MKRTIEITIEAETEMEIAEAADHLAKYVGREVFLNTDIMATARVELSKDGSPVLFTVSRTSVYRL